MGGGLLAGSALGRLVGGHRHQQEHHHGGFSNIAQSFATAGATGAIGSKLFGLFKDKPQQQQQQQQQPSPPTPQTQVHVYPVYMPSPQTSPMPGLPQPMSSPSQPYYGQPPAGSPQPGYFAAGSGIHVGTGTPISSPPLHFGGGPSPAAGGMTGFAPQMGPPLHIYGAVFADKDVTLMVRRLVTPEQSLILKGDDLVVKFGDPWPEVERKMFNVLYSYGDRPMELIAAELAISLSHKCQ